MGRYSSDSDEDRRKKYKSSRKRDKRSRSRERRKRSRSRDRRRSRSRSSSYEDYRRSRSNKKDFSTDRRYSQSSSSRSHSSSSSDDERRRSRNDKKSSTSSSQLSKEQTRRKMKKALAKAESKDEVLKRDKAVKELKQLAPDKEAILQIESNEFVPQSFSSSANNKAHQNDKENKDDSHEAAMFGTRSSVPVATSIAAVSEVKAVSQPVVSQTNDKEGLFASWLHEDEETKTARWITKLKKMRQELLAAT